MICVSVAASSPGECMAVLGNLEFAEIRLDTMKATRDDVKMLFSQPLRLIATFRQGTGTSRHGEVNDALRISLLTAAIDGGARYVDIETDSGKDFKKIITDYARAKGCSVISSFHDYYKTPDYDTLVSIAQSCLDDGADIAKIACMANSEKDALRLLSLLSHDEYHGRTIIIGMGMKGAITRVAAPLLGSPFTFASLSPGKETAEGQIDKNRLEQIMRLLRNG